MKELKFIASNLKEVSSKFNIFVVSIVFFNYTINKPGVEPGGERCAMEYSNWNVLSMKFSKKNWKFVKGMKFSNFYQTLLGLFLV